MKFIRQTQLKQHDTTQVARRVESKRFIRGVYQARQGSFPQADGFVQLKCIHCQASSRDAARGSCACRTGGSPTTNRLRNPGMPVALATAWGYFIGPDNGLLAPAVAMTGGADRAVSLEDPRFRLPADGVTFDGRDVFAPAAAVLASGQAALDDLGPVVDAAGLAPLLLPLSDVVEGRVRGQVWWVDGFGNAQTNVSPEDLRSVGLEPGRRVLVETAGDGFEMTWSPSYGEGSEGVVHVDSYGLVAVALRGGRADAAFGLVTGTVVSFRPVE